MLLLMMPLDRVKHEAMEEEMYEGRTLSIFDVHASSTSCCSSLPSTLRWTGFLIKSILTFWNQHLLLNELEVLATYSQIGCGCLNSHRMRKL